MDSPEKLTWKNWPKYTEAKLSNAFAGLRAERVRLFVEKLELGPDDIVLDLGSEDGSYLSRYYPYPQNIVIADIYEEPMKRGVEKHGLKGYVVIDPSAELPFRNGEFRAVWCNSVIEHVTVERDELATISHRDFTTRASEHQATFARQIRRVAQSYFVQTPYAHFPIESHSVLPFIAYMPHPMRYRLSQWLKSLWIKQWTADFNLYRKDRFSTDYSDATEIFEEKTLGLIKSLIAIRHSPKQ